MSKIPSKIANDWQVNKGGWKIKNEEIIDFSSSTNCHR